MAQIGTFPTGNETITAEEIAAMADILIRRYSVNAANIALDFEAGHRAMADAPRAEIWARVAARLKRGAPAPTLS